MQELRQVEAEKKLLESFLEFAGIEDVTIAAQRLRTESSNAHDDWRYWVAKRRAKEQETPASTFFEWEKRQDLERNHLYLVLNRPLLRDEWKKVAPILIGVILEKNIGFTTAVRVSTEDQITFIIKKPCL